MNGKKNGLATIKGKIGMRKSAKKVIKLVVFLSMYGRDFDKL